MKITRRRMPRSRTPRKQPKGERRHHPRYVVPSRVKGRQLTPLGFPKARYSIIQGRLRNTSAGGLCLLTNDVMKVSYLLQCELSIPKTPAAIPALMQVRWVQKNTKGLRYTVGLQFLL